MPIRNQGRRSLVGMLLLVLAVSTGCQSRVLSRNDQRWQQGYTLVLPGCLGHGPWDDQVVKGLEQARVPGVVEIHDWTRGPLLLGLNVFDEGRKQRQARAIVHKIVSYQRRYPERPVNLIGHSGGGTMVLKTLELMPGDARVQTAVLLAPGVSSDYDVRAARAHTERGVHNFYSPRDVIISGVFMAAVGEGRNLSSAALVGFEAPEGQAKYTSSLPPLVQHPYSSEMRPLGHSGGHFGWTNAAVVRDHVAPVLKQ